MIGLTRSTVSPSSSIIRRSTPWVDGCCGPMLMIIVSPSRSDSGQGTPVIDELALGRAHLLRALVGLALEPRRPSGRSGRSSLIAASGLP